MSLLYTHSLPPWQARAAGLLAALCDEVRSLAAGAGGASPWAGGGGGAGAGGGAGGGADGAAASLADHVIRGLAALLKHDAAAGADVMADAGAGAAGPAGAGRASVAGGLMAALGAGRDGTVGNAALALQLLAGEEAHLETLGRAGAVPALLQVPAEADDAACWVSARPACMRC
jgi:hypothetical protein